MGAVIRKQAAVVKVLVEAKADVEARDKNQMVPYVGRIC